MDEDPKQDWFGWNKTTIQSSIAICSPSSNFPGAYFANNSQDHLRPKLLSIHIRMIHKQGRFYERRPIGWQTVWRSLVSRSEELYLLWVTEVKIRSYQCTMNYLVDHLNSHQNNLRSMSIARELDGENEHPQGVWGV